jgi:hypothetical protein
MACLWHAWNYYMVLLARHLHYSEALLGPWCSIDISPLRWCHQAAWWLFLLILFLWGGSHTIQYQWGCWCYLIGADMLLIGSHSIIIM